MVLGIQYFKKVLAHTLLIYMFVIWQKKIKKVCLFSFDTYWSSAGQILVLQKKKIRFQYLRQTTFVTAFKMKNVLIGKENLT